MAVAVIIHTFSGLAAGVGGGLAQLPGADAPMLVALQAQMIQLIAAERGVPMQEVLAKELALTFAATMAGRSISQWLVGWLPGWGNVINASTAAALTEAVGWAAVAWLEERETSPRRRR
jgi:uncharacterized protein (DUF697 family)